MAKTKLKCLQCKVSFRSKFCVSLHQRRHRESPEASRRLECYLCKKRFVKFVRYQWHLQYHEFSISMRSSPEANKKGYKQSQHDGYSNLFASPAQSHEKEDRKFESPIF